MSVVVVAGGSHVSVLTLMGDPLAVAGDLPLYTGIVSTITGLVWSSTAAVCLFTAALPDKRLTSEVRSFLG
jgi:hypothetical protein